MTALKCDYCGSQAAVRHVERELLRAHIAPAVANLCPRCFERCRRRRPDEGAEVTIRAAHERVWRKR